MYTTLVRHRLVSSMSEQSKAIFTTAQSGADPGFHVGGGGGHFGENICKNERIWSCGGGRRRKLLYVDPPLPMSGTITVARLLHNHHYVSMYIARIFRLE